VQNIFKPAFRGNRNAETSFKAHLELAARFARDALRRRTHAGEPGGRISGKKPSRSWFPFPAGGPTDVARAPDRAIDLHENSARGVVVENHAGAGRKDRRQGSSQVRRPMATRCCSAGPTSTPSPAQSTGISASTRSRPLFPIAAICTDSMGLAVSPNVPANTFAELVKYAKDNPGKLKYGAPPGIYTQFAAEYFKAKTGTDILFVPYKGGAPRHSPTRWGGHIDMTFNNKATVLPSFKDGRFESVLPWTSAARWPELAADPRP